MQLWLRVEGVTAREVESVAVDLEASHTLDELREAVCPTDPGPLVVARTGKRLVGPAPVGSFDLRRGDTVIPRRSAPPRRDAAPLSVVVAGSAGVGQEAALLEGVPLVIGRSSSADLTVADPTLSGRHAEIRLIDGRITVTDLSSSNGTYLNGNVIVGPSALQPGDILELGDVALRIVVAPKAHATSHPVVDGLVPFTRRPRVTAAVATTVYDIEPPPEPPQKRRLSLATALLPLALAPVMVAVTHQLSYLAMAALSPVMAIASVVEDRRHGGKDHAGRIDAFRASVSSTHAALAAGLQGETASRWFRQPDPAEILRRTSGPGPALWERRMSDPDALELRVGWADLPSSARWAMREGGDPALRAEAAGVLAEHGVVRSAPVTLALQETPVVGIVGSAAAVDETAGWLTLQAAVLHSPRDLSILLAVAEARAPRWEWAAWLPHARAEGVAGAPFGAPAMAVGTREARQLLAELTSVVAGRRERAASREGRSAADTTVLVVLDQELDLPRTGLSDLLEHGPQHDVRVIWLGDRVDSLPGETGAFVELRDQQLDVTIVDGGSGLHGALRDRCPLVLMDEAAHALAGVRDASARSGGVGDLPPFGSLAELLGDKPTAASIADRWRAGGSDLAAPVGWSAAGRFSIDLRRDGPHALLGGTTGAGKSEMLQTLVASLAAHHPPHHVTFLLVDYKGGAAFKDCSALPHVVGLVTDLSGHLVQRALVSLGAELHRRERLLARAGAKDLLEMQRIAPDEAPPSLLLVIDEFATLAKELPDFVDGVVNVAQRGRSLGIHLLLATQRPAGAINDNIRANTNLRMALRMNDTMDSQDVLGVAHAATLPRELPGRAFVRVAASELTEVQIAYSGGRSTQRVRGAPLVRALRRGVVEQPPAGAPSEEAQDGPTDLQTTVRAACAAAELLLIPAPSSPWLPPLPDVVPLGKLEPPTRDDVATLGLLDIPAEQRQATATLDLASQGSLLVLGTSGAGKTTLLRSIAVSLASQASPAELTLYALDFATRGLGSLEALPHCGGVIAGDDVERVSRLFGILERWVATRRQRFADTGATSLAEHRALGSPGGVLPRAVVLLDSYAGFASVFENIDYGARLEALPHLVSSGQALGIHLVVTALRRNALPTALASVIPSALVLRLADLDDYAAAGLDSRVAKAAVLPPGRGFEGSSTREVQCAVVSADPSGTAQHQEVVRRGALLAARWPGLRAPTVETLPRELPLSAVRGLSRPLRPVIGLGEREMAPLAVDLTDSHLLVAGPLRSGKSTALAALAIGLREADPDLEMALLAPRRSPLTTLAIWSRAVRRGEDIDALCDDLQQRLATRDEDAESLVVVIDDAHELLDVAASAALEMLVRKGRDQNVRVLAAADASAALRAYGGWLTELRKDRHAILLQPDPDTDGDLVGVRLPRHAISVPGRGFLLSRFGREGLHIASG